MSQAPSAANVRPPAVAASRPLVFCTMEFRAVLQRLPIGIIVAVHQRHQIQICRHCLYINSITHRFPTPHVDLCCHGSPTPDVQPQLLQHGNVGSYSAHIDATYDCSLKSNRAVIQYRIGRVMKNTRKFYCTVKLEIPCKILRE